jgi:hypothetical protein
MFNNYKIDSKFLTVRYSSANQPRSGGGDRGGGNTRSRSDNEKSTYNDHENTNNVGADEAGWSTVTPSKQNLQSSRSKLDNMNTNGSSETLSSLNANRNETHSKTLSRSKALADSTDAKDSSSFSQIKEHTTSCKLIFSSLISSMQN